MSEDQPFMAELEEIILRKRNNSAPGTNAILYMVYKKYPKVLSVLHDILRRAWKKGKILLSWKIGEAVLISKEEDTSRPELFRSMTLKNVSGKMFFPLVLANRLLSNMTQNGYV